MRGCSASCSGFRCGVDVLLQGSCQGRDGASLHLPGDQLAPFELVRRRDGEARLDHVHSEARRAAAPSPASAPRSWRRPVTVLRHAASYRKFESAPSHSLLSFPAPTASCRPADGRGARCGRLPASLQRDEPASRHFHHAIGLRRAMKSSIFSGRAGELQGHRVVADIHDLRLEHVCHLEDLSPL